MRQCALVLAGVLVGVLGAAPPALAQESRPTVAEGEIEQSGDGQFDRAQLLAYFESARPEIRGCHHDAMRRGPVTGRVTLELTLVPGGLVRAVRVVANTTGSRVLGACLARMVRRQLLLPGPTGGRVTFRVPIDLALDPSTPAAAPDPFSRVTLETPAEDPERRIDVITVQRRLRAQAMTFRSCFERGVEVDPTLRGGELSLQISIDEAGRVAAVHASTTTLADSGVAACVEHVVRVMRFTPGAEDGVAEVTLRIVFERLRDGPPPPPPAPAPGL